MAMKDEENTANTLPCSLMLTDEKIYVCHDEQDNALIRQLDSVKLEYVAKLLVDPEYHYYCVLVRHCSPTEDTFDLNFSSPFSRLRTGVTVRRLGSSIFFLRKK